MTERRFNEAEVAAIFEQATESPPTAKQRMASSDGMTLVQLQEIGREVGIAPDDIARAARAITTGGTSAPSRTFLGLPLGTERTVELERMLSDTEWERLVVDMRETFDARGRVRQEGSLRAWNNGNLQALLEPTSTGHRVRLRTLKSGARARIVGGFAMFVASVVGLSAAALTGAIGDRGLLAALVALGVTGAVASGGTAVRLPGWARLRKQQMEDIAGRIVQRVSGDD